MQFIPQSYKYFLINRLTEIIGICLIGFAIIGFAILLTYSPFDPSFNNETTQEVQNIFGISGAIIADLLMQVFGLSSYLLLLFFLSWSYRLIIFKKLPFFVIHFFTALVSMIILDILFLLFEINIQPLNKRISDNKSFKPNVQSMQNNKLFV